ncbi:MAG: long-chain fatty acid--CoA ligase [Deltaproteobacteria bacterium]|nr:MAG: long-chain fatty acid--CoA ligase [Deltaproteobacteria bacterium]
MQQENFVCAIESNARRFRSKTALVSDDRKLTWSELDAFASGFARYLSTQGVSVGDRVAILMPNGAEFVVAFLAVLKLGATPAPLNPLVKEEELAAFKADLRPKLSVDRVVMSQGSWQTIDEVRAPSLILYTSGSTGRPKGAVFSHDALTFANHSWAEPVMGLSPDDTVLVAVPLAHSLGLNGGLLAPLLTGATIVILERFTPEAVFAAIKKHRVTVFPAVATIFRRLLNSPAFAQADFSGLRLAVSGAAPCPWELAVEWREKSATRIVRGYGMTELFRPLSFRSEDPTEVPDAVGQPVPGVEIRTVVEEKASRDGVGELWIKSPAMMDGYLDAPEETNEVISDGWFKTGDLTIISPEGYVQIVGRKRERILRGGYSVFPQEVEAVLLSHPDVAEAAVVAVPDADLGEEVAAYVSLKRTAQLSSGDLLSYCKTHLARYKYPRQVYIVPELPKGPTGKILKSALGKSEA